MDHGVLFSEALKIEAPWYIEDIEFDPLHYRLNIRINFKKGTVFEHNDERTKESTFHKAHDTEEKGVSRISCGNSCKGLIPL